MKSFVFVLLAAIPVSLCARQKEYMLTGKIAGKTEGQKVFLLRNDFESQKVFDSSVIRKGKFIFKGRMDVPRQIRLVIDRTPKEQEHSKKYWVMSDFYLENSRISFAAHADSLPSYYYNPKKKTAVPVITGSAAQAEAEAFNASVAPIRKELGRLREEYLKVYHIPAIDGKFNSKEGVELSRQSNLLEDSLQAKQWEYIRQHPNSIVAYDMAMGKLKGMYVTLTVPQLEELESLVRRGWEGTTQFERIQDAVRDSKRTAIGEKYLDFAFLKPDGEKVMLSSVMPKDKYVLLEFWASWCGPCRGEIPHLREANKHKADNFEIISISLDERDADWKKAMKEEAMTWTQLCDPRGFAGEIAKAYNITGIPFSLLLGKDGRIITVDVRGAQLDLALEKL